MNRLFDVVIVLILLVALGPVVLATIAGLSGVILPLGFLGVCLWWAFGPRKEEAE